MIWLFPGDFGILNPKTTHGTPLKMPKNAKNGKK